MTLDKTLILHEKTDALDTPGAGKIHVAYKDGELQYKNPAGETVFVGLRQSVLDEAIDDRVNDLIQPGNGITKTYDDNGNLLSLSAATNLAIANRGASTLDILSDAGADVTIPAVTTSLSGLMAAADKTKLDGLTQLTTEDIQDAAAPLFVNGVHTGLTATYNDASNRIDLAVDQEWVQDAIAPLLNHANHTNITATYNDAANRIELVGGSGGGSTLSWNTQSLALNNLSQILSNTSSGISIVSGVTQVAVGYNSVGIFFVNSTPRTPGIDPYFAVQAEINVNRNDMTTGDTVVLGFFASPNPIATGVGFGGLNTLGTGYLTIRLDVTGTTYAVNLGFSQGSTFTTITTNIPSYSTNVWRTFKLVYNRGVCSVYVDSTLVFQAMGLLTFHRSDSGRGLHPGIGVNSGGFGGSTKSAQFRNFLVSYGSDGFTLPF
jgi:hypothetical protein